MGAKRVKILCDSCADLPKPLRQQRNIACLPFNVAFGEERLYDGVDIGPDEFYRRLHTGNEMPTTSQITPAAYLEFFREAVADGSEAVYVGFSSGLSGSLQNALLSVSSPDLAGRVHVVDSLGASIGLGLMVLRAADMADAGATWESIVADMEAYRDHVHHVFTLDTLEYVRRGGRVSAFSAIAANVLDIKPVLHVDSAGKLVPIDKVRGRKRALNRLFQEMERLGANPTGQRVGICHAAVPEEAESLAERFRTQYGAADVIIGEIGAVIGAHTGPGCVSIFFESPNGREA